MLDADLASLYGVPTFRLNETVKRNIARFPPDFMFQLSPEEWANLKSHSAMSSSWGGRRTPPNAFTEQGVAMLSSVLNSERAVLVNIEIMRAFVAIRRTLQGATPEELSGRLSTLENVSRVHGGRLDTIETTLAAMETPANHAILNITVQGDMIGNTITGVLDSIGAKAPHLGLTAADNARFQEALHMARVNPPNTTRGQDALHVLKAMLEHAGGAVIGHGILSQLTRFIH
jgi:ORF6N domain